MSEELHTKSPERIEISDWLRMELSAVLNKVHDVQYSERFWGLIIEEYVKTAITRKQLLEGGNCDVNIPFLPVNSHNFPDSKTIWLEFAKNTVKAFLGRKSSARGMKLLEDQNQYRIGFPEFNGFEKFRAELGVELPEIHFQLIRPCNLFLRSKLNRIAEGIDDNFLKNSVKQLPKLYVEYFRSILNAIPLAEPEKKIFNVHNIRNFADVFILAKYTEHGAKLIWYQHGSHYGEYRWEYYHHYEHLMADEFRTWGWKISERDTPWKAYRLEAFKRLYREFDNRGEYNLMLCYPKMYSTYRKHCIDTTKFLEQNLDFKKFPEILARPRPMHKKHSHEKELSFISCENIDIGSGLEPIERQVSRSKIVVQISVPSTNFLECIYVDHPVTGILNNTEPTEVIKPYYSFLLDNGILHEDVQSLVRFLNNTNLESWWIEITGSDMYNQFKENFTGNVTAGK